MIFIRVPLFPPNRSLDWWISSKGCTTRDRDSPDSRAYLERPPLYLLALKTSPPPLCRGKPHYFAPWMSRHWENIDTRLLILPPLVAAHLSSPPPIDPFATIPRKIRSGRKSRFPPSFSSPLVSWNGGVSSMSVRSIGKRVLSRGRERSDRGWRW